VTGQGLSIRPPRHRRCCSGYRCVAAGLCGEQRPPARLRPGGRRYGWLVSWAFRGGSPVSGGWLGGKIRNASALPQVTGLALERTKIGQWSRGCVPGDHEGHSCGCRGPSGSGGCLWMAGPLQ
jgi:hypothetical protein